MTREEAIEWLKKSNPNNIIGISSEEQRDIFYKRQEAFDMAIKSLEQEPREITLEDVKEYCKPRCLSIISNELLHELTHRKIKVLEKKPCEDAIRRQDVLDYIHESEMGGWVELSTETWVEAVTNMTPVIPKQKMWQWIPVSERLPEDNTKVLVTMDATYKEKVLITWYQDKEYGFLCGLVTAWMPLPEPYESQESEVNE
jgi:hypothetical protein